MATNKKPRKKYTPKSVIKPLNMRDAWMTEGEVYASMMMLESGNFIEENLNGLAVHGDIMRRMHRDGPVNEHAQVLIQTVNTILCRGLKMLPDELSQIRYSVKITLPALVKANNFTLHRAAKEAMFSLDKHKGLLLRI